jgi:hypothetical protein
MNDDAHELVQLIWAVFSSVIESEFTWKGNAVA